MNIPATIELVESIIKDIEHYNMKSFIGRVHYDLNFAISALKDSVYGLKYAQKHLKELEKE